MARRKVKLAFMQNDAARKATYKKRRSGIMKKVKELSTLCDVTACAIVYGPYEPKPEVWPSPPEAKHVLTRFLSLSGMDKYKKMMNQEEFLRESIAKLREKLKKLVMDNKEKENTKLMFECLAGQKDLNDLSLETLGDLAWLVDSKMEIIQDRIQLLSMSPPVVPPLPPPSHPQYMMNMPNTPVAVVATKDEVTSGGGDQVEAMDLNLKYDEPQ
ncbi:agamous-like MADS-box protein AGL80 [Telopea speciosissima]|uniref:agamous-like MADS-box protein AGL80 n=1 Tax=Telopea speciosissima TaxID=54955 RepID=UPI001CC51441|nr:agamous-like MADS-box protein AGL80 [Telopea speciosissima]